MGLLPWIFQVGPSNHKGPCKSKAERSGSEKETC